MIRLACSSPSRVRAACRVSSIRCLSRHTGPVRLSQVYLPTSRASSRKHDDGLRSAQLLQQAGFIRQSSAGIFSFLPFGQRVLGKIETIVEEEMLAIGAGKVSLPNLLPPTLWQKSGRWQSTGPELWRLQDRRRSDMLLAPTHEEEITALVNGDVVSEKDLPVRLFQIGRKYRDEARPRGGLLRCREFLMKDLYTFDSSHELAQKTYDEAKAAYRRIFDRIGLPYAIAEADTGNIGGTASHEFHYLSSAGEDTLIRCPECSYTANDELATSAASSMIEALDIDHCQARLAEFPDENALAVIIAKKDDAINLVKLAKIDAGARFTSLSKPIDSWDSLQIWLDAKCAILDQDTVLEIVEAALAGTKPQTVWPAPAQFGVRDLVRTKGGDKCQQCHSTLVSDQAIEIGHTFLLGERYSAALDATFARVNQPGQERGHFQMGCYGIGITRLMGAIADATADAKGLSWPHSIAPYQACIVPANTTHLGTALQLADELGSSDFAVDDRLHLSFGTRMKDAELVGYPAVIVVGQHWDTSRKVEFQLRQTRQVSLWSLEEAIRKLASKSGNGA